MKVLLVEDRPERKRIFMEMEGIDLNNYPFLTTWDPDTFMKFKSSIKTNDLSILSEYNLIAIHKSALSLSEQDALDEYCYAYNISLVYFSGGISTSFYEESRNPTLNINSKQFYSKNLILFLDTIKDSSNSELLILQFGKNWNLNLKLQARDNLAKLIYSIENNPEPIQPEDFQNIFSPKLISIFKSEHLQVMLNDLIKNGVASNSISILDNIKNEITISIKDELGIVL